MERSAILARGAVGGLLAGVAVAAWFAVLDLIEGAPLLTPTMLGMAAFGAEFSYPNNLLVLAYSLLHFGAFAVLGAGTAWLLTAIQAPPGVGVGLAFGLLVLNAFHYGALLAGGLIADLVLPPIHVLAANLLGGAVFGVFLHRALRSSRPIGPAVVLQYPLIRRGLVVGMLGAGAVATWFFVIDIVAGRPFLTPAALGSAFLLGADGPAQVGVRPGIVMAYTLVHLAAFAAMGVAFVWVGTRLGRTPGLWLMAFMAVIVLEGLFVGIVGASAAWVMDELGWWGVLAGNLIAIAVMGTAMWTFYPELRRPLIGEPVKTAV